MQVHNCKPSESLSLYRGSTTSWLDFRTKSYQDCGFRGRNDSA